MSIMTNQLFFACVLFGLCLSASANERMFGYTYEPETMPKGGWEFEQWVTWRSQRNGTVGQDNFNRWEFRDSIEYGVTDNYTLELYLNSFQESFRDPGTDIKHSTFQWDGISIENRYQIWNPAEHKVGLTLYLEPRLSDDAAEVESKIILGQRFGRWKWALNLTHAAEWTDRYRNSEGEVELSFGLARQIGKYWGVGVEMRDHNEIPNYSEWESTAFYLGPVASYHRGRWWAVLCVMPQIFGVNFADNVDDNHQFELEGHERVNTRLIAGFSF
jgi:hypothetical protein